MGRDRVDPQYCRTTSGSRAGGASVSDERTGPPARPRPARPTYPAERSSMRRAIRHRKPSAEWECARATARALVACWASVDTGALQLLTSPTELRAARRAQPLIEGRFRLRGTEMRLVFQEQPAPAQLVWNADDCRTPTLLYEQDGRWTVWQPDSRGRTTPVEGGRAMGGRVGPPAGRPPRHRRLATDCGSLDGMAAQARWQTARNPAPRVRRRVPPTRLDCRRTRRARVDRAGHRRNHGARQTAPADDRPGRNAAARTTRPRLLKPAHRNPPGGSQSPDPALLPSPAAGAPPHPPFAQ